MLKNENSNSGTGAKDVGAEILPGDLAVRDRLDRRPVLGLKEDSGSNPVRDGLLLERRALHHVGQSLGELGLASAGSPNCSTQGDNVRFLHPPIYTNRFVPVNNSICVTADEVPCRVISMEHARAKRQPKKAPRPRKPAVPGPDGQTLGQRVTTAMAYKTGRQNGVTYRQADLIKDVAKFMQIPKEDPRYEVLQQRISAIMTGVVSESPLSSAIAASCGVSDLWLGYGWGKMLN